MPPPDVEGPVDVELPDNAPQDTSGPEHLEQPDGSVTIDFSSKKKDAPGESPFEENLADKLSDVDLAALASMLLESIDSDIQSRQEWEATCNRGVSLLGIKIEEATGEAGPEGSVSRVYHPLLMEATVRYQANFIAEMLPSDGPVKVKDDQPVVQDLSPPPALSQPVAPMGGNGGPPLDGSGGMPQMSPPMPLAGSPMMLPPAPPKPDRNVLADALEKDMNHYLTTVEKGYYPDTDRMAFPQGLYGCAFKKVYRHPIRKRPVSEFIMPQDLIVSNDAVSLTNCGRKTHRIMMRQGDVKRLQLSGFYRDVPLVTPTEEPTETQMYLKQVEGIEPKPQLPRDQRYTIYECYTDLDLADYGFDEKGVPEGLPLPYRVTLDKDSRVILEIRRNWKEDDEHYTERRRFVKYGLIPALGFYDLGFVHLLGNSSRALTAIERQLIDAGQFANFPGFLISDSGSRQDTNEMRVPPGTGRQIRTNGMRIQDIAMPLPYKEPSTVLMALASKIADDARQLGMMTDLQVGEGRQDAPVGTTIAMIEQATKVMSAVHKRNHRSQQEEFEIFRELFVEDPEALWKFAKNPARKWQQAEELADLELVPASDPNAPSHIHRLMQNAAIVQMATLAPPLFNQRNVAERSLRNLGVDDIDSLLLPPPPPSPPGGQPPDPKIAAKVAELGVKAQGQKQDMQQTVMEGQIKMQELNMEAGMKAAELQSKERIEAAKLAEQSLQNQQTAMVHNQSLPQIQPLPGAMP